MTETLLTRQDAARRLSISLTTLKRLMREGAIAYIRLPGRAVRFTAADLDAFVAAQRVEAGQPAADAADEDAPTPRRRRPAAQVVAFSARPR